VTPFAVISWQAIDLTTWLLLIALGGIFGIPQLTQIAGLVRVPASLVAPLAYVQIIAAVVFGVLIFHEVPDLWSLVGIMLIAGAGLYLVQHRGKSLGRAGSAGLPQG
jgi:drug/metabolite transporter (DMT)-like permease